MKQLHTATDQVYIFDTTLRDGEQAPGCSMNLREKLEVARQLARLRVDVIEAGFPICSQGDFEAVHAIAEQIGTLPDAPIIAGLARATEKDIQSAAKAVLPATRPRIHTFIATSPIHMRYKLKMEPEAVLAKAVNMVEYAKTLVDDIEFSLEDAGRTDWGFMVEVATAVIEAGATTINIPDTVGYVQPWNYGAQILYLMQNCQNIGQAIVSVHCHNDLGLAVANSLAGVRAGARQVECAINGLGERAGNTSLEEVVMNLRTRHDYYGVDTQIDTRELCPVSRAVSDVTGQRVQVNKAIVGANAFAHEAGIHQDGMLKNAETYEIMTPESVGWKGKGLVLGKHSGRHAFGKHLEGLGYRLDDEKLRAVLNRFKELCDKKQHVYEEDLVALVDEVVFGTLKPTWTLVDYSVVSKNGNKPSAEICLSCNGKEERAQAEGDGPIDAIFGAIDKITEPDLSLVDFTLEAVTEGEDALGRASVVVKRKDGKTVKGRAVSTDILLAAIKAFVNALNSLYRQEELVRDRDNWEAVETIVT